MEEKRIATVNDPLLRVYPSLVIEIGLPESMVLLQIEYKCSISKYFYKDQYWVPISLRDLAKDFRGNYVFPSKIFKKKKEALFSFSTIKRAADSLVDVGLLIKGRFRGISDNVEIDPRVYFYSPNFEMISALFTISVTKMKISPERAGKRIEIVPIEVRSKMKQSETSFQNETILFHSETRSYQNRNSTFHTGETILFHGDPDNTDIKGTNTTDKKESEEELSISNFRKKFYEQLSGLKLNHLTASLNQEVRDTKIKELGFDAKTEEFPSLMALFLQRAVFYDEILSRLSELDDFDRTRLAHGKMKTSLWFVATYGIHIDRAYGHLSPVTGINDTQADGLQKLINDTKYKPANRIEEKKETESW